MSNVTHRGYMILDTAGVVFATQRIQVKSIRWYSEGASAGHNLIIKDAAGVIRFHSVASGANFTDVFYPQNSWKGLTIDTLDSGTVYIEF